MGDTAAVVIRKRGNLVLLVAVLAWKGFDAVCLHEKHSKAVQYFPDRLSRAPHMWVGQHRSADPADAGPVRQPWHWRMSFLPRHWTVVYTAQGFAREIAHDILAKYLLRARIGEVPGVARALSALCPPMRDLACGYTKNAIQTEQQKSRDGPVSLEARGLDAALELVTLEMHASLGRGDMEGACAGLVYMTTLGGEAWHANEETRQWDRALSQAVDAVDQIEAPASSATAQLRVPALSPEQMKQLVFCTFCMDHAPFSDEQKQRIKNIVFAYSLNGHLGRISGEYKRSNKFRGFGETVRVFENETLESRNLPVEARNQVRVRPGGKLLGEGGRGYKGIHEDSQPASTKRYRPSREVARKIGDDAIARAPINLVE